MDAIEPQQLLLLLLLSFPLAETPSFVTYSFKSSFTFQMGRGRYYARFLETLLYYCCSPSLPAAAGPGGGSGVPHGGVPAGGVPAGG
eukprot:1237446-Pyramimonas_sp.AAC.1